MRVALVFSVVVVVACGESSRRTRPMCDKIAAVCGADLSGVCPSDRELADLERQVGKSSVDRYLSCIQAADDCMRVVGCFGDLGQGLLGGVGGPLAGPTPPPSPPPGPPAQTLVRYHRVEARPGTEHTLELAIDLELLRDVDFGAPFIEIESRCEGASDQDTAFAGRLRDLRAGERRLETVTLHEGQLSAAPRGCELTLVFDDRTTAPDRYCFDGSWTNPGGC